MSIIEIIQKRRSMRKYKQDEVSDETIKEILNAARLAPSGNNAQPWKFYVVKSKEAMIKSKLLKPL